MIAGSGRKREESVPSFKAAHVKRPDTHGKTVLPPTCYLVQGEHGVRGASSALSVLRLIEVAALVVHAAALELAEEVEEAVFIGRVTAQLLGGEKKRHVGKTFLSSGSNGVRNRF